MNTISFPGIGLSMNINPVAFTIAGRSIYWYALTILAGVIAGLCLAVKSAKKRGVSTDAIYDVCLYGLLAAIVGARIYYVIFDFDSYKNNLLDIFKLWEGGLAIYGGIIGAVIAGYIYSKVKRIPFLKLADICAPSMLLGQAIGRYGNFFNTEVFGHETALPWGMSINGDIPVHPLFLYESLWNVLGVIILLIFRDKKKAHGQVFFSYILWYSFGRFFLEGMRQPKYILMLTKTIAVSQILAILLVVISIILIILLGKKKKIVPVDGVIFDLDGTMWDSTEALVEPWNEALHEMGIDKTLTQDDLKGAMGLTIEEIGKKFLPDETDETRKAYTKRAVELETISLNKHGGKPYENLEETLKELKKRCPLFIVSNCEDGYIDCFYNSCGLSSYFTDIEYIGRTGKPKSENIKMVVERNGLKNPVYVGDTDKDRKSAKDAGVSFIHAAYGFGKVSEECESISQISHLPSKILFFE